MKEQSALVIFGQELPKKSPTWWKTVTTVFAHTSLKDKIEAEGCNWMNIEHYIEPGSIYEASALVEQLSRLTFPDGSRLAKRGVYEGYELWWMNYQNLFTRFTLPYTQYKKLLEGVREFQQVTFYKPPFKSLFSCYLRAYGRSFSILQEPGIKNPAVLPFGILIQILLTMVNIPVLMLKRQSILVSTGDKFEATRDYDFRMKFIYEELRQRNLPFVEFIRSLGSSKVILEHAWKRRRPVIYTEAVTFIARFMGAFLGGHRRARREFGDQVFSFEKDPEKLFQYMIASQYLLTVYDDMWAIRIMKCILRLIGVKTAIIPATTERNFHTVIGCKLFGIPTIGILHGAQTRQYNVYDFTPAFDGSKMFSVDKYGLWSEWWRTYYTKYSRTYRPEQLFVSGPMRPIQKHAVSASGSKSSGGKINVLFVSEIVAIPEEVVPYLDSILKYPGFSVFIKFRSNGDRFEKWLIENRPDILATIGSDRILKGTMQEAIAVCDVVVGSQSTGVIESTLQNKPFVFFNTKKWGDYFDMQFADEKYHFFARTTEELQDFIRESTEIPPTVLENFCTRFFGDPYQNGSKWVVDEIEKGL